MEDPTRDLAERSSLERTPRLAREALAPVVVDLASVELDPVDDGGHDRPDGGILGGEHLSARVALVDDQHPVADTGSDVIDTDLVLTRSARPLG